MLPKSLEVVCPSVKAALEDREEFIQTWSEFEIEQYVDTSENTASFSLGEGMGTARFCFL